MLASGTLKPSPSAIRISKLYQLSGHTVAPTAYRILCVRFTSFVRQQDTSGSAVGATLDTGGWLALSRPGLSPGKMRQAYLGAVTSVLTGWPSAVSEYMKAAPARPVQRVVMRHLLIACYPAVEQLGYTSCGPTLLLHGTQ